MGFLSKLYLGCSVRYKKTWPVARSGCEPSPEIVKAFSQEGISLRSGIWCEDRLKLTFELTEELNPAFAVQRLKGRLSFSAKKADPSFPGFSPHFFLRTLGQNTKGIVSAYIQNQVDASDLVDPLYRERMKQLRFRSEEEVDVQKTRHQGIYDLFVHVVLVTGGRYRMRSPEARKVFDALCGACGELGADPVDISMMPDHAHLLVRWPKNLSAADLLEGIKLESGKRIRRTAFWNDGGYVGTVGPYSLKVAEKRNAQVGWTV